MNKNEMELSINSDIFSEMKHDFDDILEKTISNMESKGAEEAVITMKLSISLEKGQTAFYEKEKKEYIKPNFKHDISSVMQVKDKKSGELSGDYELVYDEEEMKYTIREIEDGQLMLFGDEEVKEDYDEFNDEEELKVEYNPAFLWLRQFVGETLYVTEAMGNYTVRTEKNEIILSSASEEDSKFHVDAEKLAPHVGHGVQCVGYGGGKTLVNISIECNDCEETIFSLDLIDDEME